MDFGRTRSKTLPVEFSFRIGDPRRVGVGMDDCLGCDGVIREGVDGEALVCFTFRCEESGRRGVCGDQVGALSANCKAFKSLKEERLFFRGGPVAPIGTSPIVPKAAPKNDRPCGLEPPSNENAPNTVGRSREDGRLGERRMFASVELERPSETGPALDKLGGWLSVPWLFLLKDLHNEPTLDSFSDLLFSRMRVPNPRRLRRDVFEFREPAAVALPFESTDP